MLISCSSLCTDVQLANVDKKKTILSCGWVATDISFLSSQMFCSFTDVLFVYTCFLNNTIRFIAGDNPCQIMCLVYLHRLDLCLWAPGGVYSSSLRNGSPVYLILRHLLDCTLSCPCCLPFCP